MSAPNAPTGFQIVPAGAVGYTRVFGPALITEGATPSWHPYNMLAVTPVAGQSSTNPDGSVLISGICGDGYGASLCTVRKVGTAWQGFAYGADSYVEVRAKFVPTLDPSGGGKLPFPAIWGLDALHLAQVGGVNRWAEQDIMQWPRNSLKYIAGLGWIDWPTAAYQPNTSEVALNGINMAEYNDYAMRWEKATPTKNGFLRFYINGIERPYAVGKPYPLTWAYGGTTNVDLAGAVMDASHLGLILGTHPSCPMTVAAASVYSLSAAGNRIQ